MRRVHAGCISTRLVAPLSLFLFQIHIVGADYLPLEEDLEGTREEGGSRCHGVVLVTKVVPLAPFVNEYAEIGRVSVEFKKKLVQIVPGMRCLQVDNNVDARRNILRFWLLHFRIGSGRTLRLHSNVYWYFRATIHV